ncbi:MAG: hypothetical protein RIS35_2893 [Pseudomonadota bacterium]
MPVADRERLAGVCGTSNGFLQNIAYGYRAPGPALCVQIERATSGAVRRWDLRPDDWHLIWPELVGTEGAPEVRQGVARD